MTGSTAGGGSAGHEAGEAPGTAGLPDTVVVQVERSLRCSVAARSLGEPVDATAPHAVSWLAVVVPGSWPAKATARLPQDLQRALAAAPTVRPLLVRPVGRRQPGAGLLLAGTRPGLAWLREVDAERTPGVLAELAADTSPALAALAQGRDPGLGRRSGRPAVLVCTNGARDACCAREGRPAAALLHRRLATPEGRVGPGRRLLEQGLFARRPAGADVWEASHLGGHRFAPTAVVLPHGVLLGGLGPDPEPLADAVEGVLAGRTVLEGYRGRSTWPTHEQAAETAVRRHLAVVGVNAGPDDVVVDGSAPVDAVQGRAGGSWRVLVRHSGGRTFRVLVHRSVMEPGRPASCGATVTPVVLWDSEVDPDTAPGLWFS